ANGDEARENFEMARRTIDDLCTKVSEGRLLNEPGMEEVRQELLQMARRYYQEFLARRTNDPSYRAESGRACRRLATLLSPRDSGQDPLPLARESVAVFEELVREHPDVPTYLGDLSAAWHELGRLLFAKRDEAQAGKAYRRSRSIAERLVKDHPAID